MRYRDALGSWKSLQCAGDGDDSLGPKGAMANIERSQCLRGAAKEKHGGNVALAATIVTDIESTKLWAAEPQRVHDRANRTRSTVELAKHASQHARQRSTNSRVESGLLPQAVLSFLAFAAKHSNMQSVRMQLTSSSSSAEALRAHCANVTDP